MGKLNVKAAAQLAGVSEHTLRAWERRYQAVSPDRSETGRRYYSLEEVERVRLLHRLVERGHSISSVANLSDRKLADMLLQPVEDNASAPSSPVERLIEAIQDFKMEAMDSELSRARSQLNPRQLILEVLTRVMLEVGHRVAGGQWSVAQEHAFSAILRDHLGQALRSLLTSTGESAHRQILFAAPEGDLHEFGILMAAILAASRKGFNVKYIGCNLPASDLVLASRRLDAQVIVLGATESLAAKRKVSLKSYLQQIDRQLAPGIELWVGGTEAETIQGLKMNHPLSVMTSLQELDAKLGPLG